MGIGEESGELMVGAAEGPHHQQLLPTLPCRSFYTPHYLSVLVEGYHVLLEIFSGS